MRTSLIVLRIREAQTRFGNYVAGAVELDLALKNTLKKDVAFVLPIDDIVPKNENDSGMSQVITEQFSVVVALANDETSKDKTGWSAYDQIHSIRSELFRALVGWEIKGAESQIYYSGGRFIAVDNGYLWWEFNFAYESRIIDYDGYCDIENIGATATMLEKLQRSQLPDFNSIYSEYILWPGKDLPWKGSIPINDGSITDMETWIDLTDNPDDGGYDRGFGSAFDFYRILNRRNDPK